MQTPETESCPVCGNGPRAEDGTCPDCGTGTSRSAGAPEAAAEVGAPQADACTGCGKALNATDRFCSGCGKDRGKGGDAADGQAQAGKDVQDVARALADSLTDRMGLERIEGFSASKLLSETFRHHSEAEIEDLLTVGTHRTTPSLAEVQTDWPTPWMFMRSLLGALMIFGVFWLSWNAFRNPNLIPGLVITGAFATPVAAVLFFYEINTLRNVSLPLVFKLLFLGGVLSLFVALVLFELSEDMIWWLGASSAGIVEESAKLAAVLLIIRGALAKRYPYILNGMLFGAAVGTGFAAFESAGYALRIGLAGGSGLMMDNIIARGVLAPLGHVAWSAIAAGALWRLKGAEPFTWEMLTDKRVYPLLLLAMGLHFLWNTPIHPPFYLKNLILGAVAWVIVIALIQAGLRQVAALKTERAAGE